MKKSKVQQLENGLYRIFWKKSSGGGSSLAAVGMTHNGDRWLAPINWTAPTDEIFHWRMVKRIELLRSKHASKWQPGDLLPHELTEVWKRVKEQLAHDGNSDVVTLKPGNDAYMLRQILHYAEEVMKER